MAHFAELDSDGVVLRVIVVADASCRNSQGVEEEAVGAGFCQKLLGGNWVQTSYNGTIRKRFASPGYWYDHSRDEFVPPKPYPSWVYDHATGDWSPPVARPLDGNHEWDESTLSWTTAGG